MKLLQGISQIIFGFVLLFLFAAQGTDRTLGYLSLIVGVALILVSFFQLMKRP